MAGVSLCGIVAQAQGPTYRLGRTPTQDEISAWNLTILPDGRGLPRGTGTAKEGAQIFAQKCAQCHGTNAGSTTTYHRPLVGGKGSLTTIQPVKSIGNYWAFATTVFDYIRRGMPQNAPGSLSVNEVYAVTAFLLYRNDIVKENDVVDSETLPKIQMPARNQFFPSNPEWKPGYYQPYWEPQPIPRVKKP